ncbi:PadR family transcriptional regulator [Rhizocola hellebori]|uniref:PadR family transcriptional regulator n=1 Tax=Rhizocola hellebori TaxID=1392758 RepID=A0A8J3Q9J2_9ACTN|nr:PadR family transcriptional regulator [Rhizocola hellebori]GIH05540.1 PadR family transcriptional regulator [Rhizocola hellebori]
MRLTIPMAKVLSVFLSDVEAARYGVDLMEHSGLGSGTIYPILQKLQAAGWVSSSWEEGDPAALGRPVRRYYLLTPDGAEQARHKLAELHRSTMTAPSTARVVRPA